MTGSCTSSRWCTKCGGTTRRYERRIQTPASWTIVGIHVLAALQMIAVLVDKMIRTQIVDCAAVANWLFSQDMAHQFTRWANSGKQLVCLTRSLCCDSWTETPFASFRLFVWEILHSTIRKMNKHVQKIQKELEESKDKLEKQQHKRVTVFYKLFF